MGKTSLPLAPIDIVVRLYGDDFVTATVKGMRASCTWSEDEAVLRLGKRLFGERLSHVERLPGQPGDKDERIHSRWRIVPMGVGDGTQAP